MNLMRPYLLRGVLEWINDNGMTPHIVVDSTIHGVDVPPQSIQNGTVVLNISPRAVQGFEVGSDFVRFQTRFNSEAIWVWLPIQAITTIYSRESGRGMEFPPEMFSTSPNAQCPPAEDEAKNKRAHLRVVK